MTDYDDIQRMKQAMAQAQAEMTLFSNTLGKFSESSKRAKTSLDGLEKSLSDGLRGAFDSLILNGGTLKDAILSLSDSLFKAAYKAAIDPFTEHLSKSITTGLEGIFSNVFADGGVITQGRVTPFARGGVIEQATQFPMRGGMGLMGEAGAEAIMPLARGADGRLGVAASGGGQGRSINITMNISTPDVQGFERSQTQIAQQMGRVMQRSLRST